MGALVACTAAPLGPSVSWAVPAMARPVTSTAVDPPLCRLIDDVAAGEVVALTPVTMTRSAPKATSPEPDPAAPVPPAPVPWLPPGLAPAAPADPPVAPPVAS